MAECPVCGQPVSGPGRLCRKDAQQARRARTGVETDSAMLSLQQQGKSLREIGKQYGVSRETVRKRIVRAIERLDETEKRYLYGDR